MPSAEILRYVAFSPQPAGGNPAGVVLDATGLTDADLLAIAADVGFSETAFLLPGGRPDSAGHRVRYFSPRAEVTFCGHATIALAVAYAERSGEAGTLQLQTPAGEVPVRTRRGDDGGWAATLTSVPPTVAALAADDLARLLELMRLQSDDLDPALPPAVGYAGAWHPVLALARRARLAALDYDFPGLARLMADRSWTTIALVHRGSPNAFAARNPFPPGGVVEDPATGAAAAALGGYLRAGGHVVPPARITITQGTELGRPSTLEVLVPAGSGGIEVTGRAVAMP